MNTMTPAVSVSNVSKTFTVKTKNKQARLVRAVQDVSFTVNPGEILALLGPNGAGKTTTLDIILGQYTADSGEVHLYGKEPSKVLAEGRVSALLQTGGLLPTYTVKETVSIINSLYPSTIGVEKAMQRAGILEIADRKISKCSGGQQQRVKFALALLPDPDLIILDEPTAGMDVNARHQFWSSMREQAALGKSIIFATHYLEEAETFAERIILMGSGKIVADAPTTQLREQSGERRISCTWNPDDGDPTSLPLVSSVSTEDKARNRLVLTTENSDELARYLLNSTGARDLDITLPSLEDAFIRLTGNTEEAPLSADPQEGDLS